MDQKHFKYRFNICLKTIFLFAISCINQVAIGQDDCDCKSGESITICYYSAEQFCPPDNECRYTLDGTFMINSLAEKLQNSALFGEQGISKCPISLEVVEDVNSVEYLEQKECDIMFVGAFTEILSGDWVPTSIPQSDLATIKEWSTKCPSNLTIISQVEAAPWGYEFENLNVNPNRPDPQFSDFSIFNGSFGKISSFSQGGSFQGIFVDYPTTGYAILARDNNSEPTIVLDSLTNDIILGDIGIFCNIAGPLSVGPNIANESDILACNLFDLGCKIATNSITEFVNICSGENHITVGGQVLSETGIYVDSLLTELGCDSLIYTLLDVKPIYDTIFTQFLCSNSSYEIIVGDNVYNETNIIGTELLESSAGCDSVVHIELSFAELDTTYLFESICEGESFTVGGLAFSQTEFVEIILPNQGLCDSIIYLDLIANETYNSQIFVDLCPGEVHISSDGTVISQGLHTEFYLTKYGCDSITTTLIVNNENYQIQETYLGCQGDGYIVDIGGIVYNESNPSGVENLQSSKGCDSTVTISLIYQALDTTYLNPVLCPYETFDVNGIAYSGTTYESIVLESSKNCDSLILLDLVTLPSQEVVLSDSYDIDLNSFTTLGLPEIDSSTYEWFSDGTLSCNFCPNPNMELSDLPSYVELSYSDSYNCFYSSRAELFYRCTPFFPNVININSGAIKNRQFKVESLCAFQEYTLNIYDRWGNLVFTSNDQEQSWDGWHNAKVVDQGVYIYQMKYSTKGQPQQLAGSLTVLR